MLTGIVRAAPPIPREETLIAWLANNPGTLCYWLDRSDAYTRRFGDLIAESLAQRDYSAPDTWVPKLAEKWDIDQRQRTFTFHLRHGVKFHDGTPFTADDVLFAFETLANPKVECGHWAEALAEMAGQPIKIDQHTVRFQWKKPYFKAFEIIATVPIFPAAALRFAPGQEDSFNNSTFHREPIGTGPYKLVEWVQNDKLVLRRNDDYWGPKPQVKEIRYLILKDQEAAFQTLLKGDLDVHQLNAQQWNTLQNDPNLRGKFNSQRIARMASFQIYWNNRRPPFDDARVRKALSHLVPRDRFIQNVLTGAAEPVTGPFYFKSPSYDGSLAPYAFDPQAAAKLLADAGWKDTDEDGFLDKDGKRFEFTFLCTAGVSNWHDLSEMLKEELANAGIVMNIQPVEWATLLQRSESRDFDAYVGGGTFDWEVDAYENWHSDMAEKGGNRVGYRNAAVDKLIMQARQTIDAGQRAGINRQIHKLIYDDQPCTFLYTPVDPWAWTKHFNIEFYNYYPSSDLRRVTLNREAGK
ncbi:MAG TPA: ABC transporter substrate-binding protein [Phycisphaerae bacterium]